MSKVLPATCENNVVTVEGKTVEAEILSEGIASSSGICIIDGSSAYYLATTTPDVKVVIEGLVSMINDIGSILTAIGSGMTGSTTAPPGSLGSDVSALQAQASELESLGEALK